MAKNVENMCTIMCNSQCKHVVKNCSKNKSITPSRAKLTFPTNFSHFSHILFSNQTFPVIINVFHFSTDPITTTINNIERI